MNERIGLCLSGGGYRATLFHLGALTRLNQVGLLSRLSTIASVSGGSLAAAALAVSWPRCERDERGVFTNFEAVVAGPLAALCARDIRTAPLLWRRLSPASWKRLLVDGESAANLLADELDRHLCHGASLGLLGAIAAAGGPRFVILACALQTGVSFELGPDRVGDYRLGYTTAPELPLAVAAAASAAFPVAFPPLRLRLAAGKSGDGRPVAARFTGGTLTAAERTAIGANVLLTDGGVYDNLGLEPIWRSHDVVLVSDGGTPSALKVSQRGWLMPRLLRAQDVVQSQARAVRKRWLIAALKRGDIRGAYWGVGSDVAHFATPALASPGPTLGYRGAELARLAALRTDLTPFTPTEAGELRNHGWALARVALSRHVPELLGGETAAGPPVPALMSPPEPG